MHCLLAVCIGQYSPKKFPIVSPVLIPVDHWANNTDRWAERSRNSWMLWSNPSLQCLLRNFGPHWDIVNNIELGDSSKLVNICCMMGDRDGIRNLQAANVSHFTKFKGSSFLTDSYLRICQERDACFRAVQKCSLIWTAWRCPKRHERFLLDAQALLVNGPLIGAALVQWLFHKSCKLV